jgi:hypothetical protein
MSKHKMKMSAILPQFREQPGKAKSTKKNKSMKSVIVRRIKSSGGNRGEMMPTQLTGIGDDERHGPSSIYHLHAEHKKLNQI